MSFNQSASPVLIPLSWLGVGSILFAMGLVNFLSSIYKKGPHCDYTYRLRGTDGAGVEGEIMESVPGPCDVLGESKNDGFYTVVPTIDECLSSLILMASGTAALARGSSGLASCISNQRFLAIRPHYDEQRFVVSGYGSLDSLPNMVAVPAQPGSV